MKNRIALFCVFFVANLYSQKDSLTIGDKYLEDQLYITVTYNSLANQPSEVASSGFSYGISGGFIKDLPLNEKRNFGLGIGLGYGFDSFNHGLKISENNNQFSYEVDNTLTSNKFILHNVEIPIEIRWRNSTKTRYSFWRIYTGIKVSYNFSNTFEYSDGTNNISLSNISSFNNWQTGVIVSAGYDAFNFHFYYGITPVFDNASINGSSIDTKILKFGLTFYIL